MVPYLVLMMSGQQQFGMVGGSRVSRGGSSSVWMASRQHQFGVVDSNRDLFTGSNFAFDVV